MVDTNDDDINVQVISDESQTREEALGMAFLSYLFSEKNPDKAVMLAPYVCAMNKSAIPEFLQFCDEYLTVMRTLVNKIMLQHTDQSIN